MALLPPSVLLLDHPGTVKPPPPPPAPGVEHCRLSWSNRIYITLDPALPKSLYMFESVVQVCLAWSLRSSSNIIVFPPPFLPSFLPSCDPSNTLPPAQTHLQQDRCCSVGTERGNTASFPHSRALTLALLINCLPLFPAHAFASCEITNQDLLPERSPLPPPS